MAILGKRTPSANWEPLSFTDDICEFFQCVFIVILLPWKLCVYLSHWSVHSAFWDVLVQEPEVLMLL